MKGVIYARYSSDNQRDESIEGQLRENRVYAERKGIEIVGTYIDRAYSARTDKRPEFQRMIKDSAKRKFDVVIVWKLDRFARNRFDSAKINTCERRAIGKAGCGKIGQSVWKHDTPKRNTIVKRIDADHGKCRGFGSAKRHAFQTQASEECIVSDAFRKRKRHQL